MPKIVLGVSGSIAAYKAADLASQLVKSGYDVYPVLTEAASHFISPVTFRALTGNPCPVHIFDEHFPGEIAHIHLATIADAFVIVPASMDVIARLASGIGNDMLTASVLATDKPVILAPGMNSKMWSNPATQHNLDKLSNWGYKFIEPVSGRLACRTEGVGKMADVATIFNAIGELFQTQQLWAGKKALVTAGPTREIIDPIRYISNRSSGKMGYAIAEALAMQGAETTLVSGPVSIPAPSGVRVIKVTTAQEMCDIAMAEFRTADLIVAAAAVSDYRPIERSETKIKKADGDLSLALERTTDILAEIGKAKQPEQILVGFAAETDDVQRNASLKLELKNLDFVVANDILREGAGFDVDTNIVTILGRSGYSQHFDKMSKRELAGKILDIVRESKF